MIHVGTAGWNVPRASDGAFPVAGSHLQRYAGVLPCCEINSTFKHRHRDATYRRWVASTPATFAFSVKMPHRVTHELKLAGAGEEVGAFLREIAPLGPRLGPMLVQLPASVGLDAAVVGAFFADLRERFAGAVVCEPRHAAWFTPAAEALLDGFGIGRVGADPARVPGASLPRAAPSPSAWPAVAYFRWHGSPDVYRSSYGGPALRSFSEQVRQASATADCWCIFDNTTLGHAAANALDLRRLLGLEPPV